jgi:hypothetical protein
MNMEPKEIDGLVLDYNESGYDLGVVEISFLHDRGLKLDYDENNVRS